MDRNSKGGFRQVTKSSFFTTPNYEIDILSAVILIAMLHCFVCRTDNAVKNRFSTLCKKRAKYEALAKENNTSYVNSNNKRIIFQHGYSTDAASESAVAIKKMRYSKLCIKIDKFYTGVLLTCHPLQYRRSHIPDVAERINYGDRSHKQNGIPISQQPRAPFAVLPQNSHNVNNLPDQHRICSVKFSGYGNVFRLKIFSYKTQLLPL